jgi:nitrate reductase NapE component
MKEILVKAVVIVALLVAVLVVAYHYVVWKYPDESCYGELAPCTSELPF